jgi:CBS domain-containing protein
VSPGAPAETGRDLALLTDSRRIPVIDDDGRLVGILAVTNDLQCFCGTTAG